MSDAQPTRSHRTATENVQIFIDSYVAEHVGHIYSKLAIGVTRGVLKDSPVSSPPLMKCGGGARSVLHSTTHTRSQARIHTEYTTAVACAERVSRDGDIYSTVMIMSALSAAV